MYTARKTVSTQIVSLYVLPKLPRSSARKPLAGFVVGKKTLSKASDRNRAKRRLREAYRLVSSNRMLELGSSQDKFRLEQWYAIVWVLQADALKAGFSDIIKSVEQCLQKADQKFGAKRAAN